MFCKYLAISFVFVTGALHYRYRYIGKYLRQRWCNANETLLLQKRKNSSKIDRLFLLRYMKYSGVASVTKLVGQIFLLFRAKLVKIKLKGPIFLFLAASFDPNVLL